MNNQPTHTYHRFLDEAGDTTFYGKGNTPILGKEGVSQYFILGQTHQNPIMLNIYSTFKDALNLFFFWLTVSNFCVIK